MISDDPTPLATAHASRPILGRSRPDPRLIGLNLALLVGLGLTTLMGNQAGAQGQPVKGVPGASAPGIGPAAVAPRGRGEYAFVAGRIQGSTTHTVYILDAANRELVALEWNRNLNRFEPLGFRDLNADSQVFQRSR